LQKLIAIALLAVFGLPFASSLFALTPKTEANLPACCRRSGMHQCMAGTVERNRLHSDGPWFQAPLEKCPYSPATLVTARQGTIFWIPTRMATFAAPVSHLSGTAQNESKFRIARDRARGKRGPPRSASL
jgi:hypothetical protein